jgi:Rrf2 family nitric oxide-sensitive transcriptional repressor
MISQTTEYALRAVVWLASYPDRSLTAHQIAEATRVPAGYLAKILQGLSRAGLLSSQRGLGGGFRLARPADRLSIWQVVQAVDPISRITTCPMGFELHAGRLCALHQRLDEAIARLEKHFSRCTIASLIDSDSDVVPLCAHPPRGMTAARAVKARSGGRGRGASAARRKPSKRKKRK